MIVLDPQTVLLGSVISNAICLIVMFSLWHLNARRSNGLGFWLADYAAQFTAILLISLRPIAPAWLSIVPGVPLILLGTLFLYIGLERYLASRRSHRIQWILLGGFIAAHLYFTVMQPSIQARNIVVSLGLIAFCGQCAWLTLFRVAPPLQGVTRRLGWVLLIYCLVSVARIVADAALAPADNPYGASVYDTLAMLLYQMLSIGLTFTLFLMVNRRLVSNVENELAERVRAERQGVQLQRLYATLSQVNQAIVRVGNREELFQSICDTAITFGEFSLAWIGVLEANAEQVRAVLARGLDSSTPQFQTVNLREGPASQGLIAQAIRSGQVVTTESVSKDSSPPQWRKELQRFGFQSAAAVPFRMGGKTCGVVFLARVERDFFTAREVRLLEEMGLDISFALDSFETRRLEKLWADAFTYCGHGIALSDPATNRAITCNPAFARLLGVTPEEIPSAPIANFYSPAEFVRIKDYMAAADHTGHVRAELRVRRKDGTTFDAQLDAVSVRDDSAVPRYRVITLQDISERKQAETKLRESQELFRLLFNLSPVAYSLARLSDHKIVDANPACETLFGYTKEEVVGRRSMELDYWVDRNELAQATEIFAREGRVHDFEFPYKHRSGAAGWAILFANVVEQAGEKYVLSAFVDSTERKRAEEKVHESETRYRLISENANDVIWVLDPLARRMLYVSPSVMKMRGYTPEEVMAQPVAATLTPKSYAEINEILDAEVPAFLARGQGSRNFTVELEQPRKDGSIIQTELSATAIFDAQGQVRVIGVTRDLTERKRAQDALVASEEKYRTLTESFESIIATVDARGYFHYLNRYAADLLGSTPEATVGKRLHDLFPPEVADMQLARIQQVIATREGVVDEARSVVGNFSRWYRTSVQPIRDGAGNVQEALINSVDITAQKRVSESLRERVEQLAALHDFERVISSTFGQHITLDRLLYHAMGQLHADAADVLLLHPQRKMLEYVDGRGFRYPNVKKTQIRLGEGCAGRAAVERRVVSSPNRDHNLNDCQRLTTFLASDAFAAHHVAPLIAKGEVLGVLEVFHRVEFVPTAEWLDFFQLLAEQAAIGIENARLFERLERSNAELGIAYEETLEGWSRALDLRDKETQGHSQRVTEMSERLARAMGMRDVELRNLRRGALLHDIGKLGVPDQILRKPGPLTEQEWIVMKQHPQFARDLLAPIAYLRPALDIPYCHHEKWDGSGYPRGLKGSEIPLAARVFALIDVWDALKSDRPYRPAWSEERARAFIREQSGIHFDPEIVNVFLSSNW